MSRDPLRERKNKNLYRFIRNNPNRYSDKLGLQDDDGYRGGYYDASDAYLDMESSTAENCLIIDYVMRDGFQENQERKLEAAYHVIDVVANAELVTMRLVGGVAEAAAGLQLQKLLI